MVASWREQKHLIIVFIWVYLIYSILHCRLSLFRPAFFATQWGKNIKVSVRLARLDKVLRLLNISEPKNKACKINPKVESEEIYI